MLILANTTDAIEVALGATVTTNQLECVATWRDVTSSAFTPGRTRINTNNTSDVDVITGPSASTARVVDYVSIYNNDTVSATVTVKYDENGTESILAKVTLLTGERLEYVDGVGFRTLTADGSLKVGFSAGMASPVSALTTVALASDQTNNNASANTIADVTGLSFSVTAGVGYWFRFMIWYTAAATTTGSRWTINGPSSPTELRYRSEYALTTTSRTYNESQTAYDSPASCNATSAATAANSAVIEGYIKPSANGTLIARFASEVSSSAIVAKTGSIVQYMALPT